MCTRPTSTSSSSTGRISRPASRVPMVALRRACWASRACSPRSSSSCSKRRRSTDLQELSVCTCFVWAMDSAASADQYQQTAERRNQTKHGSLRMNTATNTEIHRWRAFAVLAVSYFMTIIDLTIVNVALPTIGRDLHFSESNLQWVVTAYGLTFGGFLLLGGRAADLLGRRRILLLGLGIFTPASLGAALATSDGFLIAMRGLQGLGAAVVLPAALSIVMNMFSEGAERNKALGIWGGIGALGATVGLIAGGFVTRYVGWEYIFFLNVPIGATALLVARRIVPESRLLGVRRRFDALGAVSVTGGLLALVYAISSAPQVGWAAPRTVALLAVSAVLAIVFLVVEWRGGVPVVAPPVFFLRAGGGGGGGG